MKVPLEYTVGPAWEGKPSDLFPEGSEAHKAMLELEAKPPVEGKYKVLAIGPDSITLGRDKS